jgi:hypothetical protein
VLFQRHYISTHAEAQDGLYYTMPNGEKKKNINHFSVSQLLDAFLRPTIEISRTSTNEMDDEEYIRMMLRKEKQRAIERKKRAGRSKPTKTQSSQKDQLDENIRQRYFPYMDEGTTKKEASPDDILVEEILDTLEVKDVTDLASQMIQAVAFVQDEMGEEREQ